MCLLWVCLIRELVYPYNYAVLFILVFIITMIAFGFLALSKEEKLKELPVIDNNKSNRERIKDIIKTDKNFMNYIYTVLLIGALGKMPFAFHIVFAKEKLAINAIQLSISTFILLGAQAIGYMIWGIVGDKRGFKSTLIISAMIFMPTLILVYLMPTISVFYLSIALFGIAQSARNVNENNLAISLCKDNTKQALYIGFRNLICGPAFAFSSLVSGAIYDSFGANVLFLVSGTCMIAGATMLHTKVKE